MSGFMTLLKFQFRTNLGISTLRYNIANNRAQAFKSLGMGLIILAVVGSMLASYVAMMSMAFDPLRKAGLEQLILFSGVSGCMALVAVFGFFYVFSTIFFAKDAGFLASLPIRPRNVFAAKFAMVLAGEYLVTLPLILVPSIYYGIRMGMGAVYYGKLAILSLLLPAIPLALVSLLCLVLMRVVSAIRKRSAVLSALGMLTVIGVLAGEGALMNAITDNMGNITVGGILDQKELIASIGDVFPPLYWAVGALSEGGTKGLTLLLWFAIASIASLAAAVSLSSLLYQKGAMALEETERTGNRKAYVAKGSSAITAIFKREWKTILRNPVYAMNSLVGIVMGPVLFNKYLFGNILMKDPDSKAIFTMLDKGSANNGLFLLVITGILLFGGLVNSAAPTVISREGRMFWLSRVIPVPPRKQVLAKLLAMYSISALAVITTGLTLWLTFNTSDTVTLMSFALALASLVPVAAANVLIDLLNPRMVWDNYNQVIKQNVNVIFGMLAGMALVAGPGYLAFRLYGGGMGLVPLFGGLLTVFVALGAVLVGVLLNTADKRYGSI